MSKVLVTGGSGFVGGHVILQLLAAGHEVRTTIRSLAKEQVVRDTLARAGARGLERLAFVAADLEHDTGWAVAATGQDYVHHVASPFPLENPKHEDELIRPAREGTLRVLRAARDAGVKRVVVTSSFAAIGYGHKDRPTPFNEEDWTDLSGGDVEPYMKSKTIAERAAWDFVAAEGNGMELSVVNPVGIFGPALNEDLSSSIVIVRRMMKGDFPGLPKLYFGVVDVRDVADLHLRAMTHPAAAGQRFLAVAGPSLSLRDVALALKAGLGPAAAKVPTRQLPDVVVRLVALFDAQVRPAVSSLGLKRQATGAKAERILGWTPRSSEDAVVASGASLVELGLV
jgi:nucleoside-diphosphate-sugar epimerase